MSSLINFFLLFMIVNYVCCNYESFNLGSIIIESDEDQVRDRRMFAYMYKHCKTDAECDKGEYCDLKTKLRLNRCSKLRMNGFSCIYDRQCASKFCELNQCAEKSRLKYTMNVCQEDEDCKSTKYCNYLFCFKKNLCCYFV